MRDGDEKRGEGKKNRPISGEITISNHGSGGRTIAQDTDLPDENALRRWHDTDVVQGIPAKESRFEWDRVIVSG